MDKKAIRRWDRAFYFPNAIRVLRIKQALITSAFMLYSMAGFSQQDKMVTFGADKEALPKALKRLAKAADVLIGYPAGETEKAGKVSLPTAQRTLNKTLTLLLKGTSLSFRFVDGRVVIFKPAPATTPQETSRKFIDVTGEVVDETGATLPGISISLQGTDRGTTTNSNGLFELGQVPEDGVIVAQGIGFPAQTFTATQVLVIQLNRSVSDLDEVQVIAYGTTTRRISTGSISSITAKDLATQPISNPLAALQGRVPGLIITQTSGVPGSSFNVLLRGQSTLDKTYTRNDPFFIIDGVPFEPGNLPTNQISNAANKPTSVTQNGLSPLNLINPADIERIDVLKDADATAIYGSRGANGVIIITTKRGEKGGLRASANVYTGISQMGNSMPMLSLQEYLLMRREAFRNDSIQMTVQNATDLLAWDTTRYTDFKSLLVGRNAMVSSGNISISGGNELTRFRAAAGYRHETSIYAAGLADKLASFSLNVLQQTRDKRLSVNISIQYGNDKNTLPRYDMMRVVNTIPNLKLYNDDGTLSWSEAGFEYASLGITNPLADLQGRAESENENLTGNLSVNYRVVDNLSIKLNAGYNSFHANEQSATPSAAINPNTGGLPSAEFANATNKSWIFEPQLQWIKEWESSRLEILGGSTFQEKIQKSIYTHGSNYQSDLLLGSISAAGNITSRNDYTQYRYSAIFGRVNYNFDDKYILNLTGRNDGSSRFGPENRWATFGAVGGAWIISREKFLLNLFPVLSYAKLRLSYGTTGNDQIGDYKYLNLWQNIPSTYNGLNGLYPISLYNPAYNWEANKKAEAGMDIGLFKDKLMVAIGYYRSRSSNQLIRYRLGGQTGFGTVVRNFPGLVQNTGWEMAISGAMKIGSVNWSSAFNATLPQNKLLEFPGLEGSSYANTYVIGKSLSVIQAYQYLGINPQTGGYTFTDKNGNGEVFGVGDYFVFGDTDMDFFGGFQNSFSWRGWAFGGFLQFTKQQGPSYINQLTTAPGFAENQPTLVLQRWQKPGDAAEIQKFTTTFTPVYSAYAAFKNSNGAFTDASFIRLKNISLSYEFAAGVLESLHLSRCRVYVEAQNLLTFTKYKGPDPETQDYYTLPPLRTIAGGIQIDL